LRRDAWRPNVVVMLNKTSPPAEPLALEPHPSAPAARALTLVLLAASAAALLWVYWGPFVQMAGHWLNDPHYSHGFIVPIFSLLLLRMRRPMLADAVLRPSWWGLALLAAGTALRLYGAYYAISWFEQISLLPCLAGLALLLGGWPVFRWSWPAIAFLGFMVPLPYFLETMLARQLRQVATLTSVYAIQTIGLPALAEGTDIKLNEHTLHVAPECIGLGMLLVFFALSTGFVLLSKRPWLDKLVILLSAVPIAVIANIIRITATAVLFEFSFTKAAHEVIHKWAGYIMMLVALALLWLELKLLEKLFIADGAGSEKMAFVPPRMAAEGEPHLAGAKPARDA
jgi:exosortase